MNDAIHIFFLTMKYFLLKLHSIRSRQESFSSFERRMMADERDLFHPREVEERSADDGGDGTGNGDEAERRYFLKKERILLEMIEELVQSRPIPISAEQLQDFLQQLADEYGDDDGDDGGQQQCPCPCPQQLQATIERIRPLLSAPS